MTLNLIHIPKTGGTSLEKFLDSNNIKYISHHLVRQNDPLHSEDKYITVIRNPLTRFVSAFNYYFSLLSQNIDNISFEQLSLDNCLSPYFTKKKLVTNSYFDPFIDEIILSFKSANELAESLSSKDETIKKRAEILCNYNHFVGISFYLDSSFINKFHKNIIWVGKLENIDNDIKALHEILEITPKYTKIQKIRENKDNNSKYLSQKAIENLIRFYDQDYKSMDLLYKYNLIDKETIVSYYSI